MFIKLATIVDIDYSHGIVYCTDDYDQPIQLYWTGLLEREIGSIVYYKETPDNLEFDGQIVNADEVFKQILGV